MDLGTPSENFAGWVPIRVYSTPAGPWVDWCYLGDRRFTEPFFEDTVKKALQKPFSLVFRHQTPVDFLSEWARISPGIAPTGFIFHMSRCGSTLVSRMLAASRQNIVISEAQPVDAVIRNLGTQGHQIDKDPLEPLRSMLSALGQKRCGTETRYFIKFDSWNTRSMDLILAAFPEVPWIFLYRDPVEVLVSQMRQRGALTVPGVITQTKGSPDLLQGRDTSPEEHCARVVAQVCEAALRHADDPHGRFINYSQLPDAVTTTIARHFGMTITPDESEQMRAEVGYNSKTPQLVFEHDVELKHRLASDKIRQAASNWVEPLYRQLETLATIG
jgi:hypothetical protein